MTDKIHKANTLQRTILSAITALTVLPSAVSLSAHAATPSTAVSTTTAPLATSTTTVDFADLVERVSGGVVRISTVKQMDQDAVTTAKAMQLLKERLGENAQLPDEPVLAQGYGSGFFVSADGYILTNHHVIAGAERITVTLQDRTELDATVVGSDESSDIAVLKVDPAQFGGKPFPALTIAKGDTLRVGESVLAIGSPFGFDYSASAGIVSAKSRNMSPEAAVPFIQSDVALNPGNSGGPLFNRRGEVVALNSLIFSDTGGYMGLSFSIPIDSVMAIYEQIKATGKVNRVRMGILVQDVDRNLAEVYGLSRPQGAILTQVTPNYPAAAAGLKVGDLILAFNGQPITHAHELLNALSRVQPNTSFSISYQRQGQRHEASGQFNAAEMADVSAAAVRSNDGVRLGLRLRELSVHEKRSLNMKGTAGGLMITRVDLVGAAARAGIMAGDIILGVNYQEVHNVADFAAAVASLPKQGVVPVQLIRQDTPAIIGMRIE